MILAYIDPGLGLLLWQAIVAAFLGVLFYVKRTRAFIVSFFQKLFHKRKPEEKVADKTATLVK